MRSGSRWEGFEGRQGGAKVVYCALKEWSGYFMKRLACALYRACPTYATVAQKSVGGVDKLFSGA